MMDGRHWRRWWLAAVVLLATLAGAWACSCMPEHPQSHFCKSDFVIIARVQRIEKAADGQHIIYKVRVRKEFKMSEKGRVALKDGRLWSIGESSMCGATLVPRKTYVITGDISRLRAHVNLCSYYEQWKNVTPRQRKGFRLLYKQGCACKVRTIGGYRRQAVGRVPHECVGGMWDCYGRHGICMMDNRGKCQWASAPVLTRCLDERKSNHTASARVRG